MPRMSKPLDLLSYIGKSIHREVLMDNAADELVANGWDYEAAYLFVIDRFPRDISEFEWGIYHCGYSLLNVC